MRFEHPDQTYNSQYNTQPHLFNREGMKRVSGIVATETVLPANGYLSKLLKRFKSAPKYSQTDIALFDQLNISPISGLPLKEGGEAYANAYSVMVAKDIAGKREDQEEPTGHYDWDGYEITRVVSSTIHHAPDVPADKYATSYPMAGKAVTYEEGFVDNVNGVQHIYTNHDTKNVGLTSSVAISYLMEQQGKDVPVGREPQEDVAYNFKAASIALAAGVLTPAILPPVYIDKAWFRGKETDDKVYQINRAWASNIRVNGLYSTNTASSFDRDDISRMIKNKDLTRDIMKGRIAGFLEDVATVKKFNEINGTNYVLGCSAFMKDSSVESYCHAFRHQLAFNLAKMVEARIWHDNLSPQNISIAAEIGDADEFKSFDDMRKVSEDSYAEDFIYYKKEIMHCLENLYLSQGIISSVLLNESPLFKIEDMWALALSYMSDNSWAKNMPYNALNPKSGEKWETDDYYSNTRLISDLSGEFKNGKN